MGVPIAMLDLKTLSNMMMPNKAHVRLTVVRIFTNDWLRKIWTSQGACHHRTIARFSQASKRAWPDTSAVSPSRCRAIAYVMPMNRWARRARVA
jgi:hypothetical protein